MLEIGSRSKKTYTHFHCNMIFSSFFRYLLYPSHRFFTKKSFLESLENMKISKVFPSYFFHTLSLLHLIIIRILNCCKMKFMKIVQIKLWSEIRLSMEEIETESIIFFPFVDGYVEQASMFFSFSRWSYVTLQKDSHRRIICGKMTIN